MSTKDTQFSFHCMICYEGFDNSASRYPVVLPCGHTYVCNSCGERLDRCMECRTPLYVTFNPNEGQTQTNQSTGTPDIRGSPGSWGRTAATARPGSRGAGGPGLNHHHPSPTPAAPPPKLIKKRIPLPKNVVLLSLIEATELATADVHQQLCRSKSEDSTEDAPPTPEQRPDHKAIIQSMQSLDEEERNEEEKIHLATSLSVGVGGTYAVAAKDGLTIFPQRPSKRAPLEHQTSIGSGGGGGTESDVDDLVDDFQRNNLESQSSHLLDYGDRLQIVAVDKDGWAKLARGYGYVSANHNQIIKVGAAVDRACRLEAMLRIVSQERKRLRREQAKVDNYFIRLMNELQHSLEKDEDLTVICRSTFSDLDISRADFDNPAMDTIVEEKKENRDVQPRIAARPDPPTMPSPQSSPSRAESPNPIPFYPPNKAPQNNQVERSKGVSLICFSPEEILQPTISESFSMMEMTNSARELLRGVGGSREEQRQQEQQQQQRLRVSQPSQSEMLAGARAWRERHGRQAANGVDFRTGMSGHSGVNSSKPVHPHELLDSTESVRKPRSFRMSSHTGLTMAKKRGNLDRSVPMRSGMWMGSGSAGTANPRTSPSSPSYYTNIGTP